MQPNGAACGAGLPETRRSVAFVTMGCAKNEVDTARMQEAVLAAGYALADDPAAADAVVVNTCSFIQAATEESLEAVFDAAALPNVASGAAKVVVAGCMPARYGADLAGELTEAAAFVPCAEEPEIARVLEGLIGGPWSTSGAAEVPTCGAAASTGGLQSEAAQPSFRPPVDAASSAKGPEGEEGERDGGWSEGCAASERNLPSLSPVLGTEASDDMHGMRAVSAYVKISDGCDRFCSYCTIPFIRGRYHSFAYEDICAEVRKALARGAREIVLIAQDTGRWGQDFAEPSTLAALMGRLAGEFPDTWFRVMYLQPEGVTDELLDVMAAHGNICSYLDIPLQHVDAGILRAMNRTGSRAQFEALLARVRGRVPGVALRTTLIAGFPGETEEQFDELCAFVEEAGFDYVGVFAYSQEEGTRAAGLAGQLSEDEKRDRAQQLRDLADAVCTPQIAARAGMEMDVLVEGREEDGQLFGRAQCQAPEVDGSVYLDSGQPGDIVPVRIVDTLFYEMEGEAL